MEPKRKDVVPSSFWTAEYIQLMKRMILLRMFCTLENNSISKYDATLEIDSEFKGKTQSSW